MAELTALGLERKAAAVHAQLAAALARHGRLVYSNSLGAEAMVLTDIIATQLPEIDMFSIDTGRLYEETHELLEKLQRRYPRAIQPGESRRAGRWWWEQPETRECGLHPRVPPAALPA